MSSARREGTLPVAEIDNKEIPLKREAAEETGL
jgi:hypothetical protein